MSDMTMNDATQAARDDTFDASLRARHAAALERLSPRVQAQLAQRRNAALRGHAARSRGHGFRYAATGLAAACALALGLHFSAVPTPTPRAAAVVAAPTPAPAGNAGNAGNAGSTMLDEDPDFYAWLASSDAQRVAME